MSITQQRLEFWESERTKPQQMRTSDQAHAELLTRFDREFAVSMQHPFLDRVGIRDRQLERVKELVEIAWDVPVYRRKYEAAGFGRGDVQTWDDFERLPVMTKPELIEAFPDGCLNPRHHEPDLFPTRSSGSSGQTLLIRVDLDAVIVDTIQGVRQFALQSGLRYRPEDLLTHVYTVPWWFDGIGERYRMAFISSLMPSGQAASLLRELRPAVLSCYPTNLRSLIAHVEEIHHDDLYLAVVHSEQSSREERAGWSETLGVPVLDEYSSEEATRIALELPCGHYHVCDDTVRLDVIHPETGGPQEPGEPGLAVITNLLNEAMPFVRYVQGDYVTRPEQPADCAIGWSQIETVGGRTNDSFTGAEGDVPAGTILDVTYRWMFDVGVHIEEFELVQQRDDLVCARFVPGRGTDGAQIARSVEHLEDLLEIVLGRRVEVEPGIVGRLAQTGRKRRPIRRAIPAAH